MSAGGRHEPLPIPSGIAAGVRAPRGAVKRTRLVLELPFGVSQAGPAEKKARVSEREVKQRPAYTPAFEQKGSRVVPPVVVARQVQLPVLFRDVEGRVGMLLSSFPHVSFSVYQKGGIDNVDVDVFTNTERSLQGARWIDERRRVTDISVTDINVLDFQNMRPADPSASNMVRAQKLDQWCIGRYNDQIPRAGVRVLDENVDVIVTGADNLAYQQQSQPVLNLLPELRVQLRDT